MACLVRQAQGHYGTGQYFRQLQPIPLFLPTRSLYQMVVSDEFA
jgi:hypothetical protein